MVERITILSLNESQKDTNTLISEILKEGTSNINNENNFTSSMSHSLKEAREEFEKKYLFNQLKKNNGNISKTADLIGMERSALHRKLKFLGIKGIN